MSDPIAFANLCSQFATANGTGTFALGARTDTKYFTIPEKIEVGSLVGYVARQGNLSEEGYGLLQSETQLTRIAAFDSSGTGIANNINPGSPVLVSFDPSASIQVYCAVPSRLFISLDAEGNPTDPSPFRNALFVQSIAEMKAEQGLSDDEAFFCANNGLFYFDASDATSPDNIDTFRPDNYPDGLFKRMRLDIQGDVLGVSSINASGTVIGGDVVGAELKLYANPKATNPNDWFSSFIDTASAAWRFRSRFNQSGGVKNFVSIFSPGTTADRVEVHVPAVLPSVSNSNGLKARSLAWLSGVSKLAYATTDASGVGTAAPFKEVALMAAAYAVADVKTVTELKAIDAAATVTDGQMARVLGSASAGDIDPFDVVWTAASFTAEDLATVFRPSVGDAASGNGRWLRAQAARDATLAASATPSVKNGTWWITNGATTITNFLNGYENQLITVQRGSADIIIAHDPTKINLNGTNKTLTITNARATFRLIGGIWYSIDNSQAPLDEDDFASDSATRSPSQQSTKAYIAAQIIDEDDFISDLAAKAPSQQSTKAYINNHAQYYNVLDACSTLSQRLNVIAGTVTLDVIWATALAAAIAIGKNIYIPPGTYTLGASITGLPVNVGSSAIGVIGAGPETKITKTAGNQSIFYCNVICPTMLLGRLDTDVAPGATVLHIESGQNPGTFAANDLLFLNDLGTLIIDNTRRGGEFVTVQDITSDTVTLWHPIKYAHLAGTVSGKYARLTKPTMLSGVFVKDMWLDANGELNTDTDTVNTINVAPEGLVVLRWAREAVVSGLRVTNFCGTGVRLLNCYQCVVEEATFLDGGSATTGTADPTSTEGLGGFSYCVNETALNEGNQFRFLRGIGVRHVRTTTSAVFNDASGVYANYGEPYGAKVFGCVGWRCKNMTFDEHELGRGTSYELCAAYDCHYAGWQIRGRETSLKMCLVSNAIGPAVWIRGNGTGNAVADHCSIDGLEIKNSNLGSTFDSIDWTVIGAVLDDSHNTRTRGIRAYKTGGPVLQVGDSISPNNSQHHDIFAEDVCQLAASNKFVVYLKKVGTTGTCRVDRIRSYSSDAKVVDLLNIATGVGAATISTSDIKGGGHTGVDYNNVSTSTIFTYNAVSLSRIARTSTQYFEMASDGTNHGIRAFSPSASAKAFVLAVSTDSSYTAPSGGALGFDVYINNVRGIGCDITGQILQGGSVISDASRLLTCRSYTVAALPSSGASGATAFASNGRAFNGVGVQEIGGAGTGVHVTRVSTAWKITGTNVTVSA